jgi:hypothetical protein
MTKHNTNKRNLGKLAQLRAIKEETGCSFSCVVCQSLGRYEKNACVKVMR